MRLISPVFTKELTQFAASKRLFVVKCVYLGLCLLGVAIILQVSRGLSMAYAGVSLAGGISVCSVIGAFLIIPFLAVGTVFGEQQANTLPLLFITHLTPFNIAQDKAMARVVQAMYVLGLIVPVFACAMLFGGVSAAQVLASLAYLMGSILLASAFAIATSAYLRNYAAALVVCFLAEVAYVVGTIMVADALDLGAEMFMGLNPFGVVNVYFRPGHVGFGEWLFLGISVIAYVIAVAVATNRMAWLKHGSPARGPAPRRPVGGPAPRPRPSTKTSSRGAPGQSGASPIYWRECFVAPTMLQKISRWIIWGFLGWGALCFGYKSLVGDTWGDDYLVYVSVPACLIFLCLLCVTSANLIPAERHKNTLPLLLSTSLCQSDLIKGYYKVIGSMFVDATVVLFALCAWSYYLKMSDWGGHYDKGYARPLLWNFSTLSLVHLAAMAPMAIWLAYSLYVSTVVQVGDSDAAQVPYRRRRVLWQIAKCALFLWSVAILIIAWDSITLVILVWPLIARLGITYCFATSIRCRTQAKALGWGLGGMTVFSLAPMIMALLSREEGWFVLSPAFWLILAVVNELGEIDQYTMLALFSFIFFIAAICVLQVLVIGNFNDLLGRQEDSRKWPSSNV